MTLRIIGLAILAGCAVALAAGNPVPLAVFAIVLMLSLGVLDRLGQHPQRHPRDSGGWTR